jgi:chromosome segregation ATPase
MKESTKSFIIIVTIVLFFGLMIYISPSRQGSKTIEQHCKNNESFCRKEVAAIKYYVDNKVAQSNKEIAQLRNELAEEKEHSSELGIEVAQVFITVGELNDKIAELELKAAAINSRLTALDTVIEISLKGSEALSKQVDDISTGLITLWGDYAVKSVENQVKLEEIQGQINTLKKQVEDLSKRPHSIIVKKTVVTPVIQCVKKRIFCR